MGDKSDVWSGHLAAWCRSGLTQAAYCGQHEVSLTRFGYWRRKQGKAAVALSPGLVPIVVHEATSTDDTIEVWPPNGLQTRLPVDMEPSRWAPMIRMLRVW